ncbi:MAG: LON peptidase substrate-binding domain-containing protein, partial [Chloroflexota bacterium]
MENVIIPVVPIRGGAVFPGVTTTISIGRRRSLAAAQAASRGNGQLIITVQYNADVEIPNEKDLTEIAILANVRDVLRAPHAGGVQMLVELKERVHFTGLVQTDPYLTGTYRSIVKEAEEIQDSDIQLMADAIAHLETYAEAMGEINQQVLSATRSRRTVGDLADYLAGLLNLPFALEIELVGELNGAARLEKVKTFLQQEMRIAKIRSDLEGEARDGANKAQREFLLREQMKAIKRELGEDPESAADELRQKVDEAGMPEEVYERVNK